MSDSELLRLWRQCPHANWQDGLSEQEIELAEGVLGVHIPPDFKSLLMSCFPVANSQGHASYPDWRDPLGSDFFDRLSWPWRSIVIDVGDYDQFWLDKWGVRPDSARARIEVARRHYERAPKLIPVLGHRYLVAQPCQVGNPVLSIYQTDVVVYGSDLHSFFMNSFHGATVGHHDHAGLGLWSDIIEYED